MTQIGEAPGDLREILEQEGVSSQRRRVRLWAAVAAAAALALLGWAWLGSGDDPALRFQTQEVRRGALTVTVTATGALEPLTQVEVGTEISGTVEVVEVDYNDRVTVGQVLARLDTDRLEAQVLEAEASLASARAQRLAARATAGDARRKLERCQALARTDVCSPQDLDSAQAAYDRAVAEEASARAMETEANARLRIGRTNLDKAVITSPIDGIVLRRQVEPGQTVAASLQTPVLFTLAENLVQMELHVAVDEADIGRVREGQPARFTVDAYPDRDFEAVITQVRYAPQAVEGVVTYETVLSVDNSELLLRPGMTATADIIVLEIEDTLLVPNAALRFRPPVQHEARAPQSRGLLGAILPRRSRDRSQDRRLEASDNPQRVWVLREGEPVVLPITTGASDGQLTQVVAGEVEPGLRVLVDYLAPAR